MRRIFILAALLLAVSCTQKAPLIGVAGSLSSGGSVSCGDAYMNAVIKAGGVPVVLPHVTDEATAREVLSHVDGLLMTGGEDVNPAWYGEEVVNETVKINASRDTSDLLYVRTAAAMEMQMLGICRGVQSINVALGGSLWQDIPSQYETGLVHKQTEPSSVTTQTMFMIGESRLKAMLGVDSVGINSHHHEALKDVASCLTVVGMASDGIVEAVEGPGIVAVQFHPEKLIASGDETFMPLFKDFVERCR